MHLQLLAFGLDPFAPFRPMAAPIEGVNS